MKLRALAIAMVLASAMGTAPLHANKMQTGCDHLNGYGTVTYGNIHLNGGENAAVAVSGLGNASIRLSVYEDNDNLIAQTICRYSTCTASWVARRNANFYVKLDNLSAHSTDFGFAMDRD
jgi:hypothetical protein